MKKLLIIPLLILGSCSTHMESRIHDDFETIQPDFTNIIPKNSQEGTIYEGDGGLFASDRRANQVGDIITVTLAETVTAVNNANGTMNKNQNFTFDLPAALFGPSSLLAKLFFISGIKEENLSTVNSQENMTSTVTTGSNFTLNGTISVTVTKVYPNGNLEVRGSRKIGYKSGTEYVRLAGVIRPEDISSANTVSSLKVADAEIEVTGTGDASNVARKGWLASFFSSVKPF